MGKPGTLRLRSGQAPVTEFMPQSRNRVPSGTARPPTSSEHELRIVFHARFPQPRDEFILKRMLGVMFRLMFDVIPYSLNIRRAHAEGSVPVLPRKIESVFAQPSRGVRFEYLHRFGQRHGGGQGNQHVSVICRASGTENRNVVSLPNSDEIANEIFAKIIGDRVAAFFCTKDAMDENVGIGMCHGGVPSGLILFLRRLPGAGACPERNRRVTGFHIPPLRGCGAGPSYRSRRASSFEAGCRTAQLAHQVFQVLVTAVCDEQTIPQQGE